MDIEAERWERIQQHTTARDRLAPKAVVVSLSAVIGEAEIVASLPGCKGTENSTTWACWAVTDTSLGYVNVEYEKANFDQYAETKLLKPLAPSINAAWVRPLHKVVGLQYGRYEAAPRVKDTYYPADPIAVRFADREFSLSENGYSVAPARLDEFVKALRDRLKF
jgi:hypothetical protein